MLNSLTLLPFRRRSCQISALSKTPDVGNMPRRPRQEVERAVHTRCCLDYLAVSWYQLIAPIKSFSVLDVVKCNKTASPSRSHYVQTVPFLIKDGSNKQIQNQWTQDLLYALVLFFLKKNIIQKLLGNSKYSKCALKYLKNSLSLISIHEPTFQTDKQDLLAQTFCSWSHFIPKARVSNLFANVPVNTHRHWDRLCGMSTYLGLKSLLKNHLKQCLKFIQFWKIILKC